MGRAGAGQKTDRPRRYPGAVRAAFLVLVVLGLGAAGCSRPGRELTTWQAADGSTVSLPGNHRFGGLPEAPYVLRSDVALAAAERGQTLTLLVPCFHDDLALRIDGAVVPNVGDSLLGEHRFLVGPHLTDHATLPLELAVSADAYELGFGLAPRLAVGAVTHPSVLARIGHYVAIADLALIAVFGLLFGLSYLLDRTRVADAAFAAGALISTVAPLTHLGVLQQLGPYAKLVMFWSLSGTNLAVLYFNAAFFDIGKPPRRLVQAFVALAVLAIPTPYSDGYTLAWVIAMFVVDLWFVAQVLRWLWGAARRGERQREARGFLATMVLLFLAIAPDMIGLNIGYAVYGGLHVLPLGAVGFTIAQAIFLGREQVVRQRQLARTAEELRRQVAERSRELAEALAKLPQRADALETDRVIAGRYRVVRKLGAGGMGVVYEVERTDDRQRLALKTLRGRAETDLMARFAREAQIAAGLDHPNVVPVLDVGVADGGLYLVMPLVTGGSLEGSRARFGDPAWARPLLRQLAGGLAALHARDIVHRDLKPGNVLVAGDQIRIADFGLASLRSSDAFGDTMASGELDSALAATAVPASPALTQRGDLFGTPGYMAPELAAGVQNASTASDVFALGVIAFEMLTGKPPFAEPPVMARLHGRSIATPAPGGLPDVIVRCLAVEPAERPTAGDVAAAL
jgi:serine/threonine-protein kinase